MIDRLLLILDRTTLDRAVDSSDTAVDRAIDSSDAAVDRAVAISVTRSEGLAAASCEAKSLAAAESTSARRTDVSPTSRSLPLWTTAKRSKSRTSATAFQICINSVSNFTIESKKLFRTARYEPK